MQNPEPGCEMNAVISVTFTCRQSQLQTLDVLDCNCKPYLLARCKKKNCSKQTAAVCCIFATVKQHAEGQCRLAILAAISFYYLKTGEINGNKCLSPTNHTTKRFKVLAMCRCVVVRSEYAIIQRAHNVCAQNFSRYSVL